jgi:hypothetical protein
MKIKTEMKLKLKMGQLILQITFIVTNFELISKILSREKAS